MALNSPIAGRLRKRAGAVIFLYAVLSTGCSDPIAQAVAESDVELLEALLRQGADANAEMSFSYPEFAGGRTKKRTLLVVAAVHGDAQIVEVLVQNGASPVLSGNDFAICPAAAFGHEAVVQILLQAGASPNPSRRCGKNGSHTPVSIARKRGHAAVVELLLEAGANR